MTYDEWMEQARQRYFRQLARESDDVPNLAKIAGISESFTYRKLAEYGLRARREMRPKRPGNELFQSLKDEDHAS